MQDVLTAPVEKEKLRKSAISAAALPAIQWPIVGVQSLNGDRPHLETENTTDTDDDPYRYGWRYVSYTADDGQEKIRRAPLTTYDLLHPQEDDFIVETTQHAKNIQYASIVIRNQVKDNPRAFVFSDLRTDLNLPNIAPIGPDVVVYLDIEEGKDWATFYCAKENAYPTLVIEVTSPSTRKDDFGPKYEFYCQAGVQFYVILDVLYDENDQVLGYELFPFELVNGQYVEIAPDSQDRYWIPPLNIALGLHEDGILCYDANGNLLLDYDQLDDALQEERDRHEQTAQALSDSIDRINAEMQRAIKQERLAQQEAARAAEQKRLAQQEKARADEQERLAQQEAARAAEQERLVQQETERAAEQERLAQQEATRAAEQERLARQEATRAAEQERLAQQEKTRAAEQERLAQQEAARAVQAEDRAAQAEAEADRLRALVAQLGGEA